MSTFLFPFEQIPKSSSIILYGAGDCGRQFFKQIRATGYCNLVLWVDKRAEELRDLYDYPVNPISDILVSKYDYLIIAIANSSISHDVSIELTSVYGVPKNKIISYIHELPADHLYKNQQEEYTHRLADSDELMEVAPQEFITSVRLDTMVRFLLCRDLVRGIENKAHLSLYSRMQLCRVGGRDRTGYFQEKAKAGTSEFIDEMKKLCESMNQDGFLRSYYIPMGGNNIAIQGQHRLAAALAMEKDIWLKYYPQLNGAENYGMQWFDDNGFDVYDKLRILRTFADLYPSCGIAVLFGPAMDQWTYLERQLQKQLTVVGSVELDFTNNYLAYENMIRDLYVDPLWRMYQIDRKISLLKMAPLRIKVILLSDEKCKGSDLFEILKSTKFELREHMSYDTDIAPIVIHASDNMEEFDRMRGILLSANNFVQLNRRISRMYSEEFIARIDKVKALLDYKKISRRDVIVVGSGSMEAFGIKKTNDIDIAVKSKYRETFGNDKISWSDEIDYVRKDSVAIQKGVVLPDDLLIEDDNYHFIFHGLKFLNLELVKRAKMVSQREKDLMDIQLIDIFEDFSANFDNKTVLKKQIEKEFHLKRHLNI